MGVQLDPLACKLIKMMKSVAVAALCFFAAVAAEADADADAHYGYYGHPLVYGHGLAYAGYYGHPYAFGHYYGKRSADAEPAAEADAHLGYYGYPLVAAVPHVSTVHGGPLHGLTYGGLYGHYLARGQLMPMPTTTTGMPTTAMATPLPTMATSATTDTPTCTTATTDTIINLLVIC